MATQPDSNCVQARNFQQSYWKLPGVRYGSKGDVYAPEISSCLVTEHAFDAY